MVLDFISPPFSIFNVSKETKQSLIFFCPLMPAALFLPFLEFLLFSSSSESSSLSLTSEIRTNIRDYPYNMITFEFAVSVEHRSGDRWVLGHFYNIKNQLRAGCGNRASTVKKKVWGRLWATFEGGSLAIIIIIIFFENIVASALKSCIE